MSGSVGRSEQQMIKSIPWIKATMAAVVTAGLGIAINYATAGESRAWAWVAVAALVVASIVVTVAVERLKNLDSTDATEGSQSLEINDSGHFEFSNSTVHGGIHNNPPVVKVIVVVAVVVLLAAAGGLLTGNLIARPDESTLASPKFDATSSATSSSAATTASTAPTLTSASIPFTQSVDIQTPTCGSSWITPKAPAEISMPMPENLAGGWKDWSEINEGGAQVGGPDYSRADVLISLDGTDTGVVEITNIKIRVVARRAPLVGTKISGDCGDQGVLRWLAVDLDRDPPAIVPEDEFDAAPADTPAEEITPIKFPYFLAKGKNPEVINIRANTNGCDCDWVIDIYWTFQGQSGIRPITNQGEPFRTSSDVNARDCSLLGDELQCID
jgi:hypothetical protein